FRLCRILSPAEGPLPRESMLNDERAAIVNLALENRITFDEADRLLDRLLDLQMGDQAGERCFIHPPCQAPPWRDGSEDLGALLKRADPSILVPTVSRQLARSIRSRDYGTFTPRFASLDVAELADHWASGKMLGLMFGGMGFERRGDATHC